MSRTSAVLLNTAEIKSSAEKKHSILKEELNLIFNFFYTLSDSENNRVFFNIFIRKKHSASEKKLNSVFNFFHTLQFS